MGGAHGCIPARHVAVVDTTGAGDAFFSGVAAGLTYGQSLEEACRIGSRLASTVVGTLKSTAPRFRPEEFGLNVKRNVKRICGTEGRIMDPKTREMAWTDEIPDEEDELPEPYEKTYRDGNVQNECWGADE